MNVKLINKFLEFVNGLSDDELKAMCQSNTNINLAGDNEFYTFPRDHKDPIGSTIYDSDGQSDILISPVEMRGKLIEDAEFLLQNTLYGK